MTELKISFVDFWPEIKFEDIFTPILSNYYNLVIDNKNPDVVFHSMFGGMKQIVNYPKAKKIMWIAENFRASQFKTDYTISFDPTEGRNFRLPLWQAYILTKPELKTRLFNNVNLHRIEGKDFDRFCSFTVSNGSNFVRNGMYATLNSYKRVHSYGKYMTNDFSLQTLTNTGEYWRDVKDKFFYNTTHKFSICFENTSSKYYCTEKLMDAFLAGSLPIYYGDPKAVLDFNEEAFINVHRLNEHGIKVIDKVKELDNDNEKYHSMFYSPIFTDLQSNKLVDNLKDFETFLLNCIKS
jgi:hypothetical protein